MLSGDNSILSKATDAKTNTDNAQIKERIQLAYHSALTGGQGSYTKESLENELEKEFGENNYNVDDSDSDNWILSAKGQDVTIPAGTTLINPNIVTIDELQENSSTYFGYDVINYAETLPTNLQNTEWQLFYAGALEGETEERIYLISKGYVGNTVLPAKNDAVPIATSGSQYKAVFGTSTTTGIIPQYSGSTDIATSMQKYNKDYFKDYTSTNPNMKAVAYMLDTTIWSPFSTSSQNYAEWAIGGPTVELLFTAYNKYAGTEYEADATSNKGYKMRKTSSSSYSDYIGQGSIENDVSTRDSAFSVSNLSGQAGGYWIASPDVATENAVVIVYSSGRVGGWKYSDASSSPPGFRPLILLNSNFQLEKVKDSNNNDVFQIVPKT